VAGAVRARESRDDTVLRLYTLGGARSELGRGGTPARPVGLEGCVPGVVFVSPIDGALMARGAVGRRVAAGALAPVLRDCRRPSGVGVDDVQGLGVRVGGLSGVEERVVRIRVVLRDRSEVGGAHLEVAGHAVPRRVVERVTGCRLPVTLLACGDLVDGRRRMEVDLRHSTAARLVARDALSIRRVRRSGNANSHGDKQNHHGQDGQCPLTHRVPRFFAPTAPPPNAHKRACAAGGISHMVVVPWPPHVLSGRNHTPAG
jgi:hypothetical protein